MTATLAVAPITLIAVFAFMTVCLSVCCCLLLFVSCISGLLVKVAELAGDYSPGQLLKNVHRKVVFDKVKFRVLAYTELYQRLHRMGATQERFAKLRNALSCIILKLLEDSATEVPDIVRCDFVIDAGNGTQRIEFAYNSATGYERPEGLNLLYRQCGAHVFNSGGIIHVCVFYC